MVHIHRMCIEPLLKNYNLIFKNSSRRDNGGMLPKADIKSYNDLNILVTQLVYKPLGSGMVERQQIQRQQQE